ncbi:hypothetical protein [Ferroacidibacillus organovorans]|uniref:hypothetical protein n=1 Tax=Ferroacidibacillus organovorans TaxID=1765683 RepID=UPI001FD3CECA|nr:hypothetical protein [Ferroacidibacillus organovorans]
MRLPDASNRYLPLQAQEGYSPYTVKAYRVQHHQLIKDIGDTITSEQLREHLQQHMHLKASSLGYNVRAIMSLFISSGWWKRISSCAIRP